MRKVGSKGDREPNMTYEQIKKLKAREFKRLCGVKPELFKEIMTEILEPELPKPKQRGGQQSSEYRRPIVDCSGILAPLVRVRLIEIRSGKIFSRQAS